MRDIAPRGAATPSRARPRTDRGTASAGRAAAAKDAATAFGNPAGMTRLDTSQVLVGVQPAYGVSHFDKSGDSRGGGNATGFAPGGALYGICSATPDLKLGLTLGSYFGGALQYQDDRSGRFYNGMVVGRPSTTVRNCAGPARRPDRGSPPCPARVLAGKPPSGRRLDPWTRRLAVAALVILAGCAGRHHVPISTRSAAYLRQAGAADLDVWLTLARECAASVKAHRLPPDDGAELRAAAGPLGGDFDAQLCRRAVRAFLDGDLSPGALHRLEAGESTDDDLETLSAVLAPDPLAGPV